MAYLGFLEKEKYENAYKRGLRQINEIKKNDFQNDERFKEVCLSVIKEMLKEIGPDEWHRMSLIDKKKPFYNPSSLKQLDDKTLKEMISNAKEAINFRNTEFYFYFFNSLNEKTKIIKAKYKDISKIEKQLKKEHFYKGFSIKQFETEEACRAHFENQ